MTECFDCAAFFDAKVAWSRETFGPANRYAGVVAHIRKELAEIEAKPDDLEEWVDVVLLAMDGAWRAAGADGRAFVAEMVRKQGVCLARTWPDWRTLAPDAVSEHVRPPAMERKRGPRPRSEDAMRMQSARSAIANALVMLDERTPAGAAAMLTIAAIHLGHLADGPQWDSVLRTLSLAAKEPT